MSVDGRAIAEVPTDRRSGDVRWLVLKSDANSGGWFLFKHRTLDEASEFDSWHATRAEALREAEVLWGVREEDWRA
jgi:hypothetical protein